MKDFPVFATEFGVAGLILKEVPYRRTAYIHIHDTLEPEKLLQECIEFCSVCGAEKIYASGHSYLENYPYVTSVVQMTLGNGEEEAPEMLWPVTQENVSRWREIYNKRMADVPNAATLEARDEKELLSSNGAYFIHRDGTLLGIGWLRENELAAIASTVPGTGESVLRTLLSIVPNETVSLEVASTNVRAIGLYEKVGFLKTKEISRWYRVK